MANEQQTSKALVLPNDNALGYIKNPMSIVDRLGSFSLTQQRIIFEILSQIQVNIKEYYDKRKAGVQQGDGELFPPQAFDVDNNITFKIPVRNLCNHTSEYEDVRKSARAMSTMMMYVEYEKEGKQYEGLRQMIAVDVPKSGGRGIRSDGSIIVSVKKYIADQVLRLDHGYSRHIKEIVNMAKGKYTIAIYTLLSKYFTDERFEGVCEIPYSSLRLRLKVDTDVTKECVGSDGKKEYISVKKRKYKAYKDFDKRVLAPAYEELKALWDADKGVDFYFDYEEVKDDKNKKLSTIGPKAIRFIMRNERKVQPVVAKEAEEVTVAREKFQAFYPLCWKKVGESVMKTWWGAIKGAECHKDGTVIVHFYGKESWMLWRQNIYLPCKNEWNSVFGDVEPILKDISK